MVKNVKYVVGKISNSIQIHHVSASGIFIVLTQNVGIKEAVHGGKMTASLRGSSGINLVYLLPDAVWSQFRIVHRQRITHNQNNSYCFLSLNII